MHRNRKSSVSDQLRSRAERLLNDKQNARPLDPPDEIAQLVHELEVHQVELELQNEELRRSQQELQESKRKYFELFELAPVSYLTLNEKGLILEANLTCCALLGTDRKELVGRRISEFIAAGCKPPFDEHMRALSDLSSRQTCELQMLRKDGASLYAAMESVPEMDGDKVRRIRTTLTDITELKKTQEALRKSRDELEIRVMERTAQLEIVNSALRMSNRELQDFAHVASHDMQEPLRKIETFGNRLRTTCQNKLGETDLDYLERMQNAARRMRSMIEALLDFSRVTTRARPFDTVDLNDSVRQALSAQEVHMERTGARVKADRLPVIEAEGSQMVQLFQNLIGNALKFHRSDVAPKIHIYAEPCTMPGAGPDRNGSGCCRIFVEDNGIGFNEKYLDRIFAPFERLHGRSEYEGSGIGLSICKKIAERHGGSITARSNPGEGATFIVTLPVKQG
jgi:PAS domain S-box-containing protein